MDKTFYIYSAEERTMYTTKAKTAEAAILNYVRHMYKSDPEELQKILNALSTNHELWAWADDFGLVVTDSPQQL